VQRFFVTFNAVHLIAHASREVDNHLPICQRAGERPIHSMTQPRCFLALRPRDSLIRTPHVPHAGDRTRNNPRSPASRPPS
jgi:hypothetical protein